MKPDDSAKKTRPLKAPRLLLGIIVPALVAGWIGTLTGQNQYYYNSPPSWYFGTDQSIRFEYGTFFCLLPFQIYLLYRFRQLANALKAKFKPERALSNSLITLAYLSSILILPCVWTYYDRTSYSWSSNYAQIMLWLGLQLFIPLNLLRSLRTAQGEKGTYIPEVALLSLAAFETYALAPSSSFYTWWWLTQLTGIGFVWTRLTDKTVPTTNSAFNGSPVPDTGSDNVINYHPFAAITRWRKQQEGALTKDLKTILCIAIPVILFCFVFAINYLANFEKQAIVKRNQAVEQKRKLQQALDLENYRESLAAQFNAIVRKRPELKDYVVGLNIDSSGRPLSNESMRYIATSEPFKSILNSSSNVNLQPLSAGAPTDEIDRKAWESRNFEKAETLVASLQAEDLSFGSPPLAGLPVSYLKTRITFEGNPPLAHVEFLELEHTELVSAFGNPGISNGTKLNSPLSNTLRREWLKQEAELDSNTDASRSFLLYSFFGGFALLIGSIMYVSASPTHIGLNNVGWRFLWRRRFNKGNGKYLYWERISRIYMERPKKSTSPLDDRLCFELLNGSVQSIKMGAIEAVEDREMLLKAITKYAPDVPRDAAVMQALQPPADHSYTELWLQALSAPPKRERLKPLADGTQLKKGNYHVVRQIGSGGQGHAYLATSSEGNNCVLKECILPVYVDVSIRRTSLEQFENEARLLRQINHPQIVKLMDFFVEDHRTYLVLEHIDGKSLRQLVKENGAFKEDQVRELALQMCEILKCLHGLKPQVIHRDFTPDNLILNKDGTLKLIDFNVAKQVVESTTSGTVVGKHAYLPPEQFRGMPECASDIYAMGATLHYMLCGADPEPIATSHPKRLRADLTDEINTLVEKATALDLQKRYSEIQQLLSDLRAAANPGESQEADGEKYSLSEKQLT